MIKSEIINSIMYAMRSKVLPEKYKTELKKIKWGFLWNNTPDKVKRNSCTRMTIYERLGMPHIEKVIQTSRIKMLGRIMTGDKEKWKLLHLQYLKMLDIVLKCLSLKLLKVKVSLNLIKYQYTRK